MATGVITGCAGFAALARNSQKRLVLLCLIPVFFMIQQFAEGFVWFHMGPPFEVTPLSSFFKNLYLFFALSFWPFFLPFAIAVAENDPLRRRICFIFCFFGFLVGSGNFYETLMLDPMPEVLGASLSYDDGITLKHIIYGVVAVVPIFLSTLPGMLFLGIMGSVSFLLAELFYREAFISVWCFFAALLSVYFFFIIARVNKNIQNSSE